MIKKIIGVTVGTPISPSKIADELKPVKTVNGKEPDANGNVEVVGNNGKDGVSVTHSWNGTKLTVTSASGTSSADLKGAKGDTGPQGPKGDTGSQGPKGDTGATGVQGPKGDTGATGAAGSNGKDGTSVTVKSVNESTADGGSNVVTFSDGKTLTVKNGSKGSQGIQGEKGETGAQGPKGDTGSQGPKGDTGSQGPKGAAGADGKSAYAFAQDGGYEGTEEEFAKKLAFTPFSEGIGKLWFTHTATFATDTAAKNGVLVAGASATAMLDTLYWLEVNGEMLKCHWERETLSSVLYDTDGNDWVSLVPNGFDSDGNAKMAVYVAAPSAGTYTYKLYDSTALALKPQYIPDGVAWKEDIPEGGGGANIDVVASVGQTIVVEEVDADGKPTKWKAAEYQPRTHWSEDAVLLEETEIAFTNNQYSGVASLEMEIGKTYTVIWNGVSYTCVAQDASDLGYAGFSGVGNKDAALGTGNTGEPFLIGAGNGYIMAIALDGSTSATVSIIGEVVTQIPQKYVDFGNAFPYIIEVTGSGTDDDPYKSDVSILEFSKAYNSGRILQMKLLRGNGVEFLIPYVIQTNEGYVRTAIFYSYFGSGVKTHVEMRANANFGYDLFIPD